MPRAALRDALRIDERDVGVGDDPAPACCAPTGPFSGRKHVLDGGRCACRQQLMRVATGSSTARASFVARRRLGSGRPHAPVVDLDQHHRRRLDAVVAHLEARRP
jgi:hypothetical protein